MLWGDARATTGDTTWVIVNNGVGTLYPVHINHYDTNGTIANYYWNETSSSLGRMTTSDTIMRNVSASELIVPFNMWIYCRDDDSLLRGGKFVVFADSVPPAPQVSHIAGTDSITIYWSGKDAKDGDSTQYRILLKEGGEPDSTVPADILSDWKRGYKASDDSHYAYMIKFKVAHSVNNYYYQVHARDARGSVTVCTPGHNFSF
jgi:hypothetical protein